LEYNIPSVPHKEKKKGREKRAQCKVDSKRAPLMRPGTRKTDWGVKVGGDKGGRKRGLRKKMERIPNVRWGG